jgi:hypothetical protein
MGLSATKRESVPVQLDPAAIDEIAVRLSDAIVAHVIEAIRAHGLLFELSRALVDAQDVSGVAVPGRRVGGACTAGARATRRVRAAYRQRTGDSEALGSTVAQTLADVLRLLDRALAPLRPARTATTWRTEQAFLMAHVQVAAVSAFNEDDAR